MKTRCCGGCVVASSASASGAGAGRECRGGEGGACTAEGLLVLMEAMSGCYKRRNSRIMLHCRSGLSGCMGEVQVTSGSRPQLPHACTHPTKLSKLRRHTVFTCCGKPSSRSPKVWQHLHAKGHPLATACVARCRCIRATGSCQRPRGPRQCLLQFRRSLAYSRVGAWSL
jgi:hypothetical protein